MPTKRMTEAQAWREVGRRIEEAESMPRKAGLCFEVDWLEDERAIPVNTGQRMFDRCIAHVRLRKGADEYSLYAWSGGAEWEARCLAAYWLALEAEEDARAKR